MGSHNSSTGRLDLPLLFSDFYKRFKKSNRYFFRKLELDRKCCSTTTTMDTLVQLWYVNCLSRSKWQNLIPHLRNRVIQDFIDKLYCTSNSFDEIFLLLITNAKSRYFMLGQNTQLRLPCRDLQRLAKDILRYASLTGLKFFLHKDKKRSLESLIDFPLKTFSLCPCTRRPLYVAMYLSRPDVVRLLLNCGARIPYEDVCNCANNDLRHPLKNVLDVMKAPIETKAQAKCLSSMVGHKERCVVSLKVFLVDLSYTSHLWTKVCKVLEEITGQKGEGKFPSLKHISRAQIRLLMKKTCCFYKIGVLENVGLPPVLISYINIDEQMPLCNEYCF